MIPKLAVEKAVEGGWEYRGGDIVFWQSTAFDPTFWKALGKALGWDENHEKGLQPIWIESWRDGDTITHLDDWQNAAMRFYDLILTGQPTDEFWEKLLN